MLTVVVVIFSVVNSVVGEKGGPTVVNTTGSVVVGYAGVVVVVVSMISHVSPINPAGQSQVKSNVSPT